MNNTTKIDFPYYEIAAERPTVLLPVKGNTVSLVIEQEVCSRILQADFSDDIGIITHFPPYNIAPERSRVRNTAHSDPLVAGNASRIVPAFPHGIRQFHRRNDKRKADEKYTLPFCFQPYR